MHGRHGQVGRLQSPPAVARVAINGRLRLGLAKPFKLRTEKTRDPWQTSLLWRSPIDSPQDIAKPRRRDRHQALTGAGQTERARSNRSENRQAPHRAG